jgi:hypothetical protein
MLKSRMQMIQEYRLLIRESVRVKFIYSIYKLEDLKPSLRQSKIVF